MHRAVLFLTRGIAVAALFTGLGIPASAEDKTLEVEARELLAIEGDPDYGEYLAGECVTCHQVSGDGEGIPPIAGLEAEYFALALLEYRDGVRENEVMRLRAKALGNGEIAALAAYFSSQKSD